MDRCQTPHQDNQQAVLQFVWKNIICQFGIPYTIITNKGKKFTNHKLGEFYDSLNIKHKMISSRHPQMNIQSKASNKVSLTELKKRLGSTKDRWTEELVEAL